MVGRAVRSGRLLEGKRLVITGVLTDDSIAWHVAISSGSRARAATGAEGRQAHHVPDPGISRLLDDACRYRCHILFQRCSEKQPFHADKRGSSGDGIAQIGPHGFDARRGLPR